MRVLFAGTPAFVVPCLEAAAEGRHVCGVLTNPDRPSGRGRRTIPPPIKEHARRLGIPSLQPGRLDNEALDRVRSLEPDVLVVAAYSRIFKKSFIDLFPRGGINVHPSLLPRLRGPSPVQAAILAGDGETGVTVQRLALRMDAGDILAQQRIPLTGRETSPELLETAFRLGAGLLRGVLQRMETGPIEGTPQRDEEATYCRLISREEGLIDWRESAVIIDRKIRAYLPWPRAHTLYGGSELYLLYGDVHTGQGAPSRPWHGAREAAVSGGEPAAREEPGTVIGVDKRCGILIQTGQGILSVERLQLRTRKAMDWRSFVNGMPDFVGSRLGV